MRPTAALPISPGRITARCCGTGSPVGMRGFMPWNAKAASTRTTPCRLPAGGCVIHNQRVIHGTGANLSNQDRLACVLVFGRGSGAGDRVAQLPLAGTAGARLAAAGRAAGASLAPAVGIRPTSLRTLLYDIKRAALALRRVYVTGG